MAFSPDGKELLSAGQDGTARLWRTDDGTLLDTLSHNGPVLSLALSPDGESIVTGSSDNTARLWTVSRRTPEDQIAKGVWTRSYHGAVTTVAYSPTGTQFLVGSQDGAVQVWTGDGKTMRRQMVHLGPVVTAAFERGGRFLVTAGEDGIAKLVGLDPPREPITLKHGGPVTALAIHPDGGTLLTGCGDGGVRLWGAEDGKQLEPAIFLAERISSIGFCPRGDRFVAGGRGRIARQYRPAPDLQGPVRFKHDATRQNSIVSVAAAPDGRRFATGGRGGELLWNIDDRSRGRALQRDGEAGEVSLVAFSPAGDRILVCGSIFRASDGSQIESGARLWDASGTAPIRSLPETADVQAAAFRDDGIGVVLGVSDGTVSTWNAATGAMEDQTVLPGGIVAIAFDPDGKIVCLSQDNVVRRLVPERGTPRKLGTPAEPKTTGSQPPGPRGASLPGDGPARTLQ